MAFIKTVLSGSYDFNEPVAQIVPVHRRGIDSQWHEKRAAARAFDFDNLEPKKGEALVHVLALGDGEKFGPNRNGDFFSTAANKKYHPTFLKASFFHHHNNKDDSPKYGRVVAAAHNPRMYRVELVLGVDTDKGAQDLDDLEKKGEFPVSMSAMVGYDECSWCHNKARTRKEYCDHAKNYLTKIASDGRQIYVDNPEPRFFDISRVYRPADRIAWTFERLSKAASDERIVGGAELAEQLGIHPPAWTPSVLSSANWASKLNTLKKLAHVDRNAATSISGAFQTRPLPDGAMSTLKKASSIDSLLGALHDSRILLSVDDFLSLTGLTKVASVSSDDIRSYVRGLLDQASSMLFDGEELCKNGSYDGGFGQLPSEISGCVKSLTSTHGLDPTRMTGRLLDNVLKSGVPSAPRCKSAAAVSPLAEPLAKEYVAYLISFTDRAGRGPNATFVQNLVGLQAG